MRWERCLRRPLISLYLPLFSSGSLIYKSRICHHLLSRNSAWKNERSFLWASSSSTSHFTARGQFFSVFSQSPPSDLAVLLWTSSSPPRLFSIRCSGPLTQYTTFPFFLWSPCFFILFSSHFLHFRIHIILLSYYLLYDPLEYFGLFLQVQAQDRLQVPMCFDCLHLFFSFQSTSFLFFSFFVLLILVLLLILQSSLSYTWRTFHNYIYLWSRYSSSQYLFYLLISLPLLFFLSPSLSKVPRTVRELKDTACLQNINYPVMTFGLVR